MEKVIKSIQTSKGGKVSLIQPDKGRPFFRYHAGAKAVKDSFRYVIRQHGQEDTATVTIKVDLPQEPGADPSGFDIQLQQFLDCVSGFMDGSRGQDVLVNLLGFEEGDPMNDDWLKEVFSNFNYLEYIGKEGYFELENHSGTYSYIRNEGYWHFEPGGKDMTLLFPASPKAEKNNARWQIRTLKTRPAETKEGLYHLPVSVSSTLSVNGQELLALQADNIRYMEYSTTPVSFDLEATVAPYQLNVRLHNQYESEFEMKAQVTDEDGCHLSWAAAAQVNQDLREPLKNESIYLHHGELRFNELTFTNLGSLWEAIRHDVNDQETIDKIVAVDVLLKNEKIGTLRYLLKEEAIELIYLDGKTQNISDIIEAHFKKYFSEPKPSGAVRNQAFNLSARSIGKASFKPTLSLGSTIKTHYNKLSEAMRIRTARKGFDLEALWNSILYFFKVTKTPDKPGKPAFPGGVIRPDLPGGVLDPGVIKPDFPGGIIDPGIIKPDKPGTVIDPGVIKPDKPGTVIDPGLIKPDKPGTVIDPGVIKPGIPGGVIDPGVIRPDKPGVTIDPGLIRPDKPGIVIDPGMIRPDGFIDPTMKRPEAFIKPVVEHDSPAKPVELSGAPGIKRADIAKPAPVEPKTPVKKTPTTKASTKAKPATTTKAKPSAEVKPTPAKAPAKAKPASTAKATTKPAPTAKTPAKAPAKAVKPTAKTPAKTTRKSPTTRKKK